VETILKLAIKVAEQTGQKYIMSIAWNDWGIFLYSQGKTDDALEAWEKAIDLAQAVGDVSMKVALETNIGLILMSQGNYEEAQRRFQNTVDLAERANLVQYRNVGIANLAICTYSLGRLDEARELILRSNYEEDLVKLMEAQITLEIGDGFVFEVPQIEDNAKEDLQKLVEVEQRLAFGDYQGAYNLVLNDNQDYYWHWALARAHARWRLGLPIEAKILAELRVEDGRDPAILVSLAQEYAQFIEAVVVGNWTTEAREWLKDCVEKYNASPIGIFARDVALSLTD
jgi:Tfp pilus assembly protein PilF